MVKKILLIADVRGWAYDDAAKNWKDCLKGEYDIDILYLGDFPQVKVNSKFRRALKLVQSGMLSPKECKDVFNDRKLYTHKDGTSLKPIFDHKKYQGIYFFYSRALCDSRLTATEMPLNKVGVGINNEKWVEEGAGDFYDTYLKGVKVLTGSNQFILDEFKGIHPNIFRVSQSINPNTFFKMRKENISTRTGKDFIVGWSGNFNNTLKNFELIRESCKLAGVKFRYSRDLTRKELNIWYNDLDALICASKSEGGPLILLEAGACGIPIITTPVGLAREIIRDRDNGLNIDYNKNTIVKKIRELSENLKLRERLGVELSKEVLSKWTYEARIDEVRAVFEELCE